MAPAESKIYIAVPVLNEPFFFQTFIAPLIPFYGIYKEIVICINQPDDFHSRPEKSEITINNMALLAELSSLDMPFLRVIDRCSPGKGWKSRNGGPGLARKTIMDDIAGRADANDLIVSLDADTIVENNFFKAIREALDKDSSAVAIEVPYYHPLTGSDKLDRAMLTYEIYLRYYTLNMHLIGNPYCFTALGASFSIKVKTYKSLRGITPFKSGEDFYFLQKLTKYGKVLHWADTLVYPGSRISDRVIFGTGVAINKLMNDPLTSYPFFSKQYFNEVKTTYLLFENLFEKDFDTPMTEFLTEIFKSDDIWGPLRKNFKNKERFKRACAEKADALRIYQFLRYRRLKDDIINDEKNIAVLINELSDLPDMDIFLPADFKLLTTDTPGLNKIRNFLFEKEGYYRKLSARIT